MYYKSCITVMDSWQWGHGCCTKWHYGLFSCLCQLSEGKQKIKDVDSLIKCLAQQEVQYHAPNWYYTARPRGLEKWWYPGIREKNLKNYGKMCYTLCSSKARTCQRMSPPEQLGSSLPGIWVSLTPTPQHRDLYQFHSTKARLPLHPSESILKNWFYMVNLKTL